MRFAHRSDLLLALVVLVCALTLCAEADLFKDIFQKNKNKDKNTTPAPAQTNSPEVKQEELKQAAKKQPIVAKDDAETTKLADELASTRRGPAGRRRPNVANMIKNSNAQRRTAEQDQAENEQEEEPTPQKRESRTNNRRRIIEQVEESKGSKESGAEPQNIGKSRESLKPNLRPRNRPIYVDQSAVSKFSSKFKSNFKDAVKVAYKASKEAVKNLPGQLQKASDSLSALLKLDNKGRLLALIAEVDEDIQFVRKQFSQFSIDWSPLMERALNYLGTENLQKVDIKGKDELDHRRDALHLLVFGYELMRFMSIWREQMLNAHEAYKLYLETVKDEMVDHKGNSLTAGRQDVDSYYIFELRAIHNYLLLTSWLDFDAIAIEHRMKLDHLMEVEDEVLKNYESDYFRGIIILQELYEPAIEEFENEKEQVLENVSSNVCGEADPRLDSHAIHEGDDLSASICVPQEEMDNVSDFFDTFRDTLNKETIDGVDCKMPAELSDFLEKLRPQLEYNTLVYKSKFLKELKKAREESN